MAMSIIDAISGSRLDVLISLRATIAQNIEDGVASRDLAALTKRLSDIDTEVRALQADNDPVAEAADLGPEEWTP